MYVITCLLFHYRIASVRADLCAYFITKNNLRREQGACAWSNVTQPLGAFRRVIYTPSARNLHTATL
jgi:hypothetical protein